MLCNAVVIRTYKKDVDVSFGLSDLYTLSLWRDQGASPEQRQT